MSLATYMDAVITPNRSLSARGFIVLIAVITACNCASAAVFYFMGAVYVPMFLGLDLVAVIAAFAASYHAARQVERIQVTAHAVRVIHETPRWSRLVWESPTAFTRVDRETDDDRLVALRLALSGRTAPVAAALSPGERAQFARALEDAIWNARRGIQPTG